MYLYPFENQILPKIRVKLQKNKIQPKTPAPYLPVTFHHLPWNLVFLNGVFLDKEKKEFRANEKNSVFAIPDTLVAEPL